MRTTFPRCGDGWSEDTRITYFKQVIILLAAVLCFFALASPVVHAEPADPAAGTAAVAFVPADGKPRGIRLRAQTTNTIITEDAAGVWADTEVEVQLQNRGKSAVALPVGLPGQQPTAYVTTTLELPQISEVSIDKRPLTLSPLAPGERPAIRASALITVPVEGTVVLRVRYRQAVPARDNLAAYVYPLTSGAVWAGAPESLNFRLTFRPAIAQERIMYLASGASSPRPGVYAWEWHGIKAPSNVTAVFVTNGWWRGVEAARAAAAAPGSGLSEHAALAEKYWHLATLAPPDFAPAASFYDRAFPHALESWRAAISAPGATSSPSDLARAHERLAGLYLAQGSRAGDSAARTYLQLAVDELTAAAALDPTNDELMGSAASLRERLARVATSQSGGATASRHSAELLARVGSQSPLWLQEEGRQNAVAQAEAAVAAGDLPAARSLVDEAFGAEALQLQDARRPAVTQVLLDVRSNRDHRKISMELVDGDRRGSASELVQETATALRQVAPVVSAGNALTITLAYPDPASLLAAQDRLAAALPQLPELALLSSALTTRRLAWPEQAGFLVRTSHYEERIDLSRSAAAWEQEARKLEAAADEAEQSSEALDRVRSRLWGADARAWRDLAALSRATYNVELQEQGAGPEWLQARVHQFYRESSVGREWVVRAGETRQLEMAILGWRYDRVALTAGAAVLLAVLAVVFLWFVSR